MKQVLSAVQYIHKLDIVHFDIKPDNILLSGDTLENSLDVRLCDFETAMNVTAASRKVALQGGTRRYSSPESRRKVIKAEAQCFFAQDVWSWGVTLYCCLWGVDFFDNLTRDDRQVIRDTIESFSDMRVRYALTNALTFQWDKRATADELVQILKD